MARAAMCQPFDQVGAAIPFRALRAVRLVSLATKEQQLPARNDKALVEGKGELVGAGGGVNRRPRHQKRIQGAIVFVGDVGEMVVGKSRVEMLPGAINPGPDR